jgi:hypothetical protein
MGPVDVGHGLQRVGLAFDGAQRRLLQVVVERGLHHQAVLLQVGVVLSAQSSSHLRT